MANPSVTYTFVNSTTADATQVNQNFTDLINSLTDGTKSLTVDAITAGGTVTLNGDVNLGNASGDTITATGTFDSALIPNASETYALGSATVGWSGIYLADNSQRVGILPSASMSATWNLTLPTTAGSTSNILRNNGSGALAWTSMTVDASSNLAGVGTIGCGAITTTGVFSCTGATITCQPATGTAELVAISTNSNAGVSLESDTGTDDNHWRMRVDTSSTSSIWWYEVNEASYAARLSTSGLRVATDTTNPTERLEVAGNISVEGSSGIRFVSGGNEYLSYYATSNVTSGLTWTNGTPSSYIVNLCRVGAMVSLTLKISGCTISGSGAQQATGAIPSAFRPTENIYTIANMEINGTDTVVGVEIQNDGDLIIYKTLAGGSFAGSDTLATPVTGARSVSLCWNR